MHDRFNPGSMEDMSSSLVVSSSPPNIQKIEFQLKSFPESVRTCPQHGDDCPRFAELRKGTFGIDPQEERKRLQKLESYKIPKEQPESAYDEIAFLALSITDTPICYIGMCYNDHLVYKSAYSTTTGPYQGIIQANRVDAICSHAILQDEVLHVEDCSQDPRLSCCPIILGGAYKFYAGTPLITPEGHRLGILCVLDTKARTLTESQLFGLQVLGRQVIAQLELKTQIEELKLAELELQRRNQELRDLNSERVKFLGMIGHDIRQPLCSIQVSSEMLAHEVNSDHPAFELVDNIQSSAAFMSFLMDNLLHVSANDDSSMAISLNSRLSDPLVILSRNILANTRLASRKKIMLKLEIDPSIPYEKDGISKPLVLVDVFRIEQVLNNLVGNAIKFSFSGTTITVRASLVKEDRTEYILISVEDQGQGIPADEISLLFDASKKISTRPTANENTTGLGLSIVKQIISLHSGKVRAESTVGRGSKFSFTLPISSTSGLRSPSSECSPIIGPPAAVEKALEDEILNESPPKSLNILVAEDNVLNQKLITAVLSKRGHHVTTVRNGRDAVTAFSESHYDVVLLDHEMPEMNGLDAALLIRQLSDNVPLISMSGYLSPEMEELRRKAGMSRFITKPFKVKRLLSAVEGAFSEFQAEKS